MPKVLEKALQRRAAEHGFKKDSPRYKRYVYGTLALVEKRKREHDARTDASKTLRGEKNGTD